MSGIGASLRPTSQLYVHVLSLSNLFLSIFPPKRSFYQLTRDGSDSYRDQAKAPWTSSSRTSAPIPLAALNVSMTIPATNLYLMNRLTDSDQEDLTSLSIYPYTKRIWERVLTLGKVSSKLCLLTKRGKLFELKSLQ